MKEIRPPTQLELTGVELNIDDMLDCEQTVVARISSCEVKIVCIVHKSRYNGPGVPPTKWDEEHLMLDLSGEGIEINHTEGFHQLIPAIDSD